ncbi:MAG: ribonuclease H-like domain-containing protein, partial [Treponema sp.]|nr:ribonuclease H-like domain-containing protein [Treponema sp.]
MGNLRDRLRHIQSIKKLEKPKEARRDISGLLEKGWEVCAFNVLKRYVKVKAPKMPKKLPPAAVIVIPDLGKCEMPSLGDFLFFDLETTGLSGGAGTIAFLAAFGRFEKAGTLGITQYLLLDYPGENDFLENVLKEFESPKSVIVSYNGKSFDSQIIKTRCLMNRMTPPAYHHAD